MSLAKPSSTRVSCRYVLSDVFEGPKQPSRRAYRKTDVAQDGCTVVCRAPNCYNIGHHRCGACELESYCSEACRRKDRSRHEADCVLNTSAARRRLLQSFDRQAPCRGRAECPHAVVSFCRHCEATLCSKWECSKAHLERCNSYWEASLRREWVFIEWALPQQKQQRGKEGRREKKNPEVGEDWLIVEHYRGSLG